MNTLEICNAALTLLNIPALASLDDDSDAAALVKRHFAPLRDRLLREHSWSFAEASWPLSAAAGPASPFADLPLGCPLPADCIRAEGLADGGRMRLVGRLAYVAALPATLLYTRRVEDSTRFDPLFAQALVHLLASEVALSCTRDANLAQHHLGQYQRLLLVAESADSAENVDRYRRRPPRGSFLAARFGGL